MAYFASKVRAIAALAVTMAFALPASALTTISINSFDAGWYRSDGYHSTANTNILAGSTSSGSYNNFFAFDLSGIAGQVVSASLEIAGNNGWYRNFSGNATYDVRQVTTSVSSLLGGTGGVAAYTDLGDGTLYGSTSVSTPGNNYRRMPTVTIALNGALDDLTAAQGNQIVFGGSTNANPHLWGYSNGATAAQLTVSFDPTIVLPIPAPAVLLLTALGLTTLAARRKRAQAG